MQKEDYDNYDDWLEKIYSLQLRIFNNKQEREDIEIAAEIFSHNEEYGKFDFSTYDREFNRSLKVIDRHLNLNCGKFILIQGK